MSRTPLIRVLRRAYQLTQLSRKSGIPHDELVGMLSTRQQPPSRISRRRLLQGGLAVASAAAAIGLGHRPKPVAAQQNLSPILIVGAGIAGLTAAYRLRQAGVPVDVVEARNDVGGRMRTLQNVAGTTLGAEMGGEFINTDHTHLRSLAEELGLTLVDLYAAQQGLADETFYFEGRKIPMETIIRDFAPVAEQISADLEAIANFESYAVFDQATVELDNVSLAEYLERIPTSEVLRNIINTAYTTEYGLDTDRQSCLNLLWYIGTEPGEFKMFGSSDERFHIDGGNDQVPTILANRLSDAITTGLALEAIQELSDGRYQVSLRSSLYSEERVYERVILAIPFTTLRDVALIMELPPAKRLAIAAFDSSTNTKLITSYREKVWRTDYNSTGTVFSDLDFQNTWETSQSRYKSGSIGLLTNYTGGQKGVVLENMASRQAAQEFQPLINEVFPGTASAAFPGAAIRTSWINEPFSKGSYACYRVGQWTQFYGVEGERVGNLFFIGEQCSWEYQGYMEGGCETGEWVALEILDELGLGEAAAQQRQRIRRNLTARARLPFRSPLARTRYGDRRLDAIARNLRQS